jgi:integrase
MNNEPAFKLDHRSRLYFVAIPIAGTKRHKWVCTGERSLKAAQDVIKSMGVDRLLHLHNAQAVTSEAISLITTGKAVTCLEVYRLWHEWIKGRRAPRTITSYRDVLERMFVDLDCAEKPIAFLTEALMTEWLESRPHAFNTAVRLLASIRSLIKFASARAYIAGNPSALMEVNRRNMTVEQLEEKHHQPYSEEEWAKVLTLPADCIWRDWAILSYCTGLRKVDCISLEWASVGADRIVAYPLKSRRKLGARIVLPLSDPLIGRPEMLDLVQRLLARERDDPTYVWPNQQVLVSMGENHYTMRKHFGQMLTKMGIVGKTFHGLRVSFARRLETAGVTIDDIAKKMAHSSTTQTAVYLGK